MELEKLKNKVLNGGDISRQEAIDLYKEDYDELRKAAEEIREHFCQDQFDMCTIINAKSGHCPENCKFCAQSTHSHAEVEVYSLLDKDTIVKDAIEKYRRGVPRYSLVSSGKSLTEDDIDKVCEIVKDIHEQEPEVKVCLSGGLISAEGFKKLKDAGVLRIHNNLESSENFFKEICTSHTYDQKIQAIKDAKNAGMEVCSGGIIGLGEDIEDRVDMFFNLRNLNVASIPVNVLNPVKGTPMENNKILDQEEINRTIAICRFINPKAAIRLAGGRANMEELGKSCFRSGANAAITGDMLTTRGASLEDDMQMVKEMDYDICAM
ncbi:MULTISPECIES: biotin synthase BioB [Anaerococcus]|uniref:Biotin synthase n=1 Tax=Anaerococcus nagyae TaxID=1755241 RepID=A0A3E2TFP9_9FIRM|nr:MULTISPECIES: biotin synthase BioB [Anaerococcus]MDU2353748.1 biotin synthase BioB [Anaerococcus sp.]MDU3211831.1 biotin synthase BioB [Anaerococcus sp.]RGB74698.1 biotin synthase BioB [Anaerococcus nagyae]